MNHTPVTESEMSVQKPAVAKEPWADVGGCVWEIRQNVECVECPHCAFIFAAIHTVEPEGYDCPNCEGCPDAASTAARPNEPIVAQCLSELQQVFPDYKYFAVEAAEGAPRMRYKVIVGSSYYDSRIQFFNADTLIEAMQQVRKWKESQS